MPAVTIRRIAPAKPTPDHEDDLAHKQTINDLRNAEEQWDTRLNPVHFCLAEQPTLRHQQHLLNATIEPICRDQRMPLNAPNRDAFIDTVKSLSGFAT
jgi:hypothetical protein